MNSKIITLTTDFGTADGYVGAVKGVILSINPAVKLVDLSNEIPSYDIVIGAFHLGCSFEYFPKGSIHVAVVDPGVGSQRKPILIVTKDHYFIGPDNGLFTLVLRKSPPKAIYELTEKKYFRKDLSHTFHGRDIFGPVSAHISKGVNPSKMGKKCLSIKQLTDFEVGCSERGIKGKILFFDKFGNALVSIHRNHLKKAEKGSMSVRCQGQTFPLYRTYSEIPEGKPGALFSSSGFLEIAIREGSFEEKAGLRRGCEVIVLEK